MARPVRLPKRRSKYGNVKTVVDGITFDSKLEAKRWGELKLLACAGKITQLVRQCSFTLKVGDVAIGKWIMDFYYVEVAGMHQIAEDAKGMWTPLAKWKRRHFEAQYPDVIFCEIRK